MLTAVPFVKIRQAVRFTNFRGLDLAKANWCVTVVKINSGQLVVCKVETCSSNQTVGFLHRLIEMTETITAMLGLKMLSHYMGQMLHSRGGALNRQFSNGNKERQ